MIVEPLSGPDDEWVHDTLARLWGGEPLVSASGAHYVADLIGLKAVDDDGAQGFCHYRIDEGALELVTLAVTGSAKGVGTFLMDAALDAAREAGCRKVWLVTTSDNARAIAFYERMGFERTGVMEGWLARVREFKPDLDVPDHDGLIYEMKL